MNEHETDPIDEDIIEDDDAIMDDDDNIMLDDEIIEDESDDFDVVEDIEDDIESELDVDHEHDVDVEYELAINDETEDDSQSEFDLDNDDEAELESELDGDHEHDFYDELPIPQEATADELDIDAALAAVSQLTLLTQDEPIDYSDESDYEPAPEDTIQEFTRETEHTPDYTVEFEQPRELSMSRGQMASVIPALTLIILGGWLTFTLTTSNTPPPSGLLFSVILIAVGAIFLSQWLTSARWSRGNFFFGSSLLLIGGLQLYFSQVSPDSLSNGWTLWIVALGIALFGTGYIAVPRLSRLAIMGVVTIVAGAIGYVLTSGTLDPTVITFVSNLWFVGVAIVIFMMVAPLLRRRQ